LRPSEAGPKRFLLITPALKRIARTVLQRARRLGAPDIMQGSQLHSLTPLSRAFGYDRGQPIDRIYIEDFLEAHSADVRGHVLEATDDTYSRRLGGARITGQDVIHRIPGNDSATIVGDLADPETLPANSFDCIILTQTLQYVFDLQAAAKNLHHALRRGGVALITVPGIAPLHPGGWGDDQYWLFTKAGLERLLATAFDAARIEVETFGNLYAATAFLHGAAVEDVSKSKLRPVDASYPVIVAARAVA